MDEFGAEKPREVIIAEIEHKLLSWESSELKSIRESVKPEFEDEEFLGIKKHYFDIAADAPVEIDDDVISEEELKAHGLEHAKVIIGRVYKDYGIMLADALMSLNAGRPESFIEAVKDAIFYAENDNRPDLADLFETLVILK